MSNPSGISQGIEALLIKRTTGRSITYNTKTDGVGSKVMRWSWNKRENYPGGLILVLDNRNPEAAVNLLSSSCAEWDVGTQALERGDYIEFKTYNSTGGTLTRRFYGKITEIREGANGTLILEAVNMIKVFDSLFKNIQIMKMYYDQAIYNTTTDDGVLSILGPTGADVIQPYAFLGYAHTDIRRTFGSGGAANGFNMVTSTTYETSMAFIAEGDGLLGVVANIATIGYESAPAAADGTCKIYIHPDYENQMVTAIDLGNQTVNTPATVTQNYDFDLVSANKPIYVTKGERYWMRFVGNLTGAGTRLSVQIKNDNTYPVDVYYSTIDNWTNRTKVNNTVLDVDVDFANYLEVSQDNIVYDSGTPQTLIYSEFNEITTVDSYYAFHRGKISYYRDFLTLKEITERLIDSTAAILHDVSANLDRELPTYTTKGKSIGECLREIMDIFEDSGAWDGKQHVMECKEVAQTFTCRIGKSLNITDDTESYILSHPDDTANDDEHIINQLNLSKNNKLKYAGVIVEGKAPNGEPIVVQRSDRATSSSTFAQMDGLTEWLTYNDPNIRSYEEALVMCYRLLDSIQREVWEGTIKLSGQHHLMDTDNTSDSFGSGKIIKLNWSPLQISATKMKVTGQEMSKNETTIYINNKDPIVKNRKTDGWGREERSSAFAVPTETEDVVYINVFLDDTISGTPGLILLKDSAGADLDDQTFTPVNVYTSASIYGAGAADKYNLVTIYGVVRPGNSYVDDSGVTTAEPRSIGEIEIYTSTPTLIKTVDLIQSNVNEGAYKWKGQKVIVEINYKST